jgi:signal transduction histidine kinase
MPKLFSWKRWPLTVKLTVAMTTMIVIVVASVTSLSIRREQQTFRAELQQQADLLLSTLAAAAADPLYTLDADELSDMMEALGAQALGADRQILASGRVYDSQGRIIGDAYDPLVEFSLEGDPIGEQLVNSDTTVFKWQPDQLVAGRAVIVGRQRLGAVSVGLPTASLQAKVAAVRTQGLGVALVTVAIGTLLALLLSRSITGPLQELVQNTRRIAAGDLTRKITPIKTSYELAVLSNALEHMQTELSQLYLGLEQQVAARTAELARTNERLQREIIEREQAQQSLVQARDQALEASRLKTELLAKVSHELRTPLGAILGYTELLQEGTFGALSKQQIGITAEVVDSTHYLTNLVEELLDQAQVESGRVTLDIRPFALKDLVDQVEARMRVLAQAKGLALSFAIAAEMPPILSGDQHRLQQILVNLVSNAIKFTTAGAVAVSFYCPAPEHWAMQVSDTGPGIPEEAQAYIFEPFQQVDGSLTREHEGTGLGLSIVKHLTIQMGGQVILESEVGRGSTFTTVFPLETAQGEAL